MRVGGSVREVVVGGRDWLCAGWVYLDVFFKLSLLTNKCIRVDKLGFVM